MLRRLVPTLLRSAESAAAVTPKLTVSLLSPHSAVVDKEEVDMVIIPSQEGLFGVLAGHVPTIAALRPGVVSIHKSGSIENYFVSSGFATVAADSTTEISAVEAVKVSDLDKEAVRAGLAEFVAKAEKAVSDADKAEAQIGVEVFSAMQFAVDAQPQH